MYWKETELGVILKYRNLTLILLLGCILLNSCSKEEDEIYSLAKCDYQEYKYYNGAKDTLGEMSNEYIVVAFDSIYTNSEINSFIESTVQFDPNYSNEIHYSIYSSYKLSAIKLAESKICIEITDLICEINKSPLVVFSHYTITTNDCNNAIWEPIGNVCVNSYNNIFYVKVFDENELTDLNNKIVETKTELIGQNTFMPKWFTLSATKNSNGNTLKMANYFYESGLFEHSEPEIIKLAVE